MIETITITAPDDWHCHLRDEAYLLRTVTDTSRYFRRAVVMPNLYHPVTTVAQAIAYRDRILQVAPASFTPLMTLYLTTDMTSNEIWLGKNTGVITACKLYPAGATTHSTRGIQHINSIYPLLETLERCNLPLLIHGETTDPADDVTTREARFIERALIPLLQTFPALRVVLEHISTQTAVEFITTAAHPIAATITPHHLCLNLNDLLGDGIRPHYYCKPIVKYKADQAALIQAAISGNPKFFLGTDSAPHSQNQKECAVGCAGLYNAHAALEMYAEVFSEYNALDRLENFASHFGPAFYQLPSNTSTITLIRQPWSVPDTLDFGCAGEKLIPFFAGKTLPWKIKS